MPNDELKATAQVLIRRPTSEVFDAFANPELMTKFWFPRTSGPLETGAAIAWYVGTGEDSPVIEVNVQEIEPGALIRIKWGEDGKFSTVEWKFTSQPDQATFVEITETGFAGSPDEIVAKAIDSAGGFNQVLIAAKALLEHGVEINVVKDHAPNGC